MWLLLLAVSLLPGEDVVRESVDLVEVNHLFNDKGEHVFDQVVFYDLDLPNGKFQVRAWRLIKSADQLPYRDWRHGDYVTMWYDGEQLRRVRSPSLQETWTQYDPEQVEREFLPKEKRRNLRKLKVRKQK